MSKANHISKNTKITSNWAGVSNHTNPISNGIKNTRINTQMTVIASNILRKRWLGLITPKRRLTNACKAIRNLCGADCMYCQTWQKLSFRSAFQVQSTYVLSALSLRAHRGMPGLRSAQTSDWPENRSTQRLLFFIAVCVI